MLALSLGIWRVGVFVAQPSLARMAPLLAAAAVTSPALPPSGITLENLAIAIPDPRFGSLAAAALLFFVPTFFGHGVAPHGCWWRMSSSAVSGPAVFRLTLGRCGHHPTSFYLVLWLANVILLTLIGISTVLAALAGFQREAQNMKPLRIFLVLCIAAAAARFGPDTHPFGEVSVPRGAGMNSPASAACFTRMCRIGGSRASTAGSASLRAQLHAHDAGGHAVRGQRQSAC
jgi:hypothetical protein